MLIKLLDQLTREALPVCVADGGQIDAIRTLVLAGHVRADIPPPARTLGGYRQPPAKVLEVTALGREMALRFVQPSPDPAAGRKKDLSVSVRNGRRRRP